MRQIIKTEVFCLFSLFGQAAQLCYSLLFGISKMREEKAFDVTLKTQQAASIDNASVLAVSPS